MMSAYCQPASFMVESLCGDEEVSASPSGHAGWRVTNIMETLARRRELRYQRLSFGLATFNVVTFLLYAGARIYVESLGESYVSRRFFGQTLILLPIWALCWFFGFIMIVGTLAKYRRLEWYGIVAACIYAVPIFMASIFVHVTFWYSFGKL